MGLRVKVLFFDCSVLSSSDQSASDKLKQMMRQMIASIPMKDINTIWYLKFLCPTSSKQQSIMNHFFCLVDGSNWEFLWNLNLGESLSAIAKNVDEKLQIETQQGEMIKSLLKTMDDDFTKLIPPKFHYLLSQSSEGSKIDAEFYYLFSPVSSDSPLLNIVKKNDNRHHYFIVNQSMMRKRKRLESDAQNVVHLDVVDSEYFLRIFGSDDRMYYEERRMLLNFSKSFKDSFNFENNKSWIRPELIKHLEVVHSLSNDINTRFNELYKDHPNEFIKKKQELLKNLNLLCTIDDQLHQQKYIRSLMDELNLSNSLAKDATMWNQGTIMLLFYGINAQMKVYCKDCHILICGECGIFLHNFYCCYNYFAQYDQNPLYYKIKTTLDRLPRLMKQKKRSVIIDEIMAKKICDLLNIKQNE